jgi:hypothetical protein
VCNPAVTSANSFEALLLYDWVYRGTSDGGYLIDAEYHGDVTANLSLLSATPLQIAWTGDVVGTASFKESRQDVTTPNSTSTLQGEGSIVPLLGLMPKMTLIVDPVACTYTIDVGITLNTLHTDPDGKQTRKDALIVNMHAGVRPLEPTPDIVLPFNANFEGRSQLWAVMNRDRDSFVPLGFAAELANPITVVMGGASPIWALVPK